MTADQSMGRSTDPSDACIEGRTPPFFTGAAAAVLGRVGFAALSYANLVLAARLLDQNSFGLYMLAVSFVTTATIVGSFGSQNTVLVLIPKYSATEPERARGIFTLVARRVWTISALIALVSILGADPITAALAEPEAAPYLRVISIGLPFAATLSLTRAGLQATYAFVAGVFTSGLLQATLLQIGLLGVMVSHAAPQSAVPLCYAGSFAVTAVVALVRLGREPLLGPGWAFAPAEKEPGVGALSSRFVMINLFMNLRSSVVVYALAITLAADRLALYAAAQRSANLVALALVGINFVFAPLISAVWESGDHERLRRLYRQATKWSLALSLPACVSMVAAAPGILGLFGTGYRDGVYALVWLAVGQLVNAATGSVGYVLMMTGRERTLLVYSAAVTLVSGLSVAAIAPVYGVTGAAAVAGTTWALFNIAMLWHVRGLLGMLPYDRNTLRVLAAGAIAGLAGAIVYPTAWASEAGPLAGFGISVGAVLVTYFGILIAWGLDEADRDMMAHAVERLRRSSRPKG